MARDTDPKLQQQVIYSVYVRNHTPEGTFRAVIPDLDRIRDLGVDWIWLMPIHPIGEKGRKGTLGCPYANRDYRSVNPEYGTLDDFKALVQAVHARGMKVMIDVVYNHTSPDSVLLAEHPEWFWRRPDGAVGSKVAEWTDVADLDYAAPGLWDYQIETLRFWAGLVDGFRCDVASFVPVDFWKRARAAAEVNPGCVWLAESVHLAFGNAFRARGFYAARDTEAFDAFDIEYSYDVQEGFDRYLRGEAPLSTYLELLAFQEGVYPPNYNKLRYLENHDLPRAASWERNGFELANLTAFLYFLKGTTLLYAGQEFADAHVPSLFERDPVDRGTGRDLAPLLRSLYAIKRDALGADDAFAARADDAGDVAVLERVNAAGRKLGVFSLKGRAADVAVDVPDGNYVNLIDGKTVAVERGRLRCGGTPVILAVSGGDPARTVPEV